MSLGRFDQIKSPTDQTGRQTAGLDAGRRQSISTAAIALALIFRSLSPSLTCGVTCRKAPSHWLESLDKAHSWKLLIGWASAREREPSQSDTQNSITTQTTTTTTCETVHRLARSAAGGGDAALEFGLTSLGSGGRAGDESAGRREFA